MAMGPEEIDISSSGCMVPFAIYSCHVQFVSKVEWTYGRTLSFGFSVLRISLVA